MRSRPFHDCWKCWRSPVPWLRLTRWVVDKIAKRIRQGNAHYCLAVKNNQPTLHHGLIKYFSDHLEDDFARVKSRRFEKEEEGHGRQESRWYFICPVPDDLPDRHRWPI